MLDTHAAVKRLQVAGMDERQAEAIVDTIHATISDPLQARLDTFITKADLRSELTTFKRRFTIKLYVGGAAVVVLLTALDFLIGP